jgi:hypothetical protein
VNIIGIEYHASVKILGIHFTTTVRQSALRRWQAVTDGIRVHARETQQRAESPPAHAIRPKLYVSEDVVLPLPQGFERQTNTAVALFLWGGDIFRVPLSTLQRRKQQEGWALLNVAAKCRTLLHFRLQSQSPDHRTLTATWFRAWNPQTLEPNPPQIQRMPVGMEYLTQFAPDTAYIDPQGRSESCKAYKHRIDTTMVVLLRETPEPSEMRVQRLWPDTAWVRAWRNLHEAPVADDIKMSWYRAQMIYTPQTYDYIESTRTHRLFADTVIQMTISNTALLILEDVWCGIGQGTDLRESYELLRDRYRTDG